mmetsp:Transcript_26804/g.92211  ORF Transcript_26804/g.92211 Transcript_26804/m.92211 type:complete len:201 (-) Transcript_26804:231-833(-)
MKRLAAATRRKTRPLPGPGTRSYASANHRAALLKPPGASTSTTPSRALCWPAPCCSVSLASCWGRTTSPRASTPSFDTPSSAAPWPRLPLRWRTLRWWSGTKSFRFYCRNARRRASSAPMALSTSAASRRSTRPDSSTPTRTFPNRKTRPRSRPSCASWYRPCAWTIPASGKPSKPAADVSKTRTRRPRSTTPRATPKAT